jgi:Na+-driven multidrug efflux pump
MNQTRNPYLINKALKNFLLASVMTMAIGQLTTTVDGIIVSHLVSPDALSAITLFLPVNLVITAVTTLLAMGACIIATKAMGRRDKDAVNGILSTALMSVLFAGLCLGVVGFAFSDKIAWLLTQDEHLYPLLVPYLRVMLGCALAMMLNTFFNQCVQIDGFPKRVTMAMAIIGVTNILFDLVLVNIWGIVGSAIATILSFLFAIAFQSTHLFRKQSGIRFHLGLSGLSKYLGPNLIQGLPMLISNLVLTFLFFAMNNIVQGSLGHNGMFVMSVCMNIFMIGLMLSNGFGSTITSLGGFLYGQSDYSGVRFLVKRCLQAILLLTITFTVFVEVAPGVISSMFGANTPELQQLANDGLQVFILCIAPFCLVIAMSNHFQMIGKIALSPILILMIPVFLLSLMKLFAYLDPSPDATEHTPLLWYAFPVSSGLAFLCTFLLSEIIRFKERTTHMTLLTLLPLNQNNPTYELSIPNDETHFNQTIGNLKDIILQFCKDEKRINQISNSVEELLLNTLHHSGIKGNGHYSDLRFILADDRFTVSLKYEGRAFNPLLVSVENRKIGLNIVFGLCEELDYKYMYGQNMLYLTWTLLNEK